MTKIITVCNQKGGVGKTTTAINISSLLAESGRKVLLIDLDGQANASSGIGLRLNETELSSYDLIKHNHVSAKEVIRKTPFKVDVIPSHINLSGVELEINSYFGRETILKRKIAEVMNDYDYIIIDTAPSLSLLTINALSLSTEVLITVENNPLALDGLNKLFETINDVRSIFNPDIIVSGIAITMYDNKTKLGKSVIDKLNTDDRTKDIVFNTYIRRNIKLAEAIDGGKPINHYDKDCNGYFDYQSLVNELITKELSNG